MEITGKYIKTYFRNRRSGYTAFLFEARNIGAIRCAGIIPRYTERTPLKLTGHFEEDNGKSSFIVSGSIFDSGNSKGAVDYFSHNLCPGVGKVTASIIQKRLCEDNDFESVIMEDKALDVLKSVKGLEESQAVVILAKLRTSVVCKKLYEKLKAYGGEYKNAEAIFNIYGKDSLEQLKRNPYQFITSSSLPFGVADSYAHNNGHTYYDTERIKALVNQTFFFMENTGSTYLTLQEMLFFFRKIETCQGAFKELIPDSLVTWYLTQAPVGYVEKTESEIRFYLKKYWESESRIAEILWRMQKDRKEIIPADVISTYMAEETELDDTQKKAYGILNYSGISVITGGPGTGKTTTIKKLIKKFHEYCPDKTFSLCAPTGRAAEKITESSGYPASTIHKLLEFESLYGEESGPARNEQYPLDADLVIVDEFSMVDTKLFEQLLHALKENCILIVVGDSNQLKSVKPGKLLEDLILSGLFPLYQFQFNHRQSKGNSIIENSAKIVNMDTNLVTDEHFHIERFTNTREINERYKELIKAEYDTKNCMGLQVLAPMKAGECGIMQLNRTAQDIVVNHNNPSYAYGEDVFYITDKVMTVRNNYDEGYMNGDIGTLVNFTKEASYVDLMGECVSIKYKDYDDLTLAYAMTVHKSQGSEAKKVILLLTKDTPKSLLENAIVYVGVTRAKEEIWILSEEDSLEMAITNKQKTIRKTGLCEKLKKRWS